MLDIYMPKMNVKLLELQGDFSFLSIYMLLLFKVASVLIGVSLTSEQELFINSKVCVT